MPDRSYLTGDGPTNQEGQITEAQKNDLRRPSLMTASNKTCSFDDEDDSGPAIDQKVNNSNINIITTSKKSKLKADDDFEKEIKKRQATEKRIRLERQKNNAQKEKQATIARQQEIEEKLHESQTLDPDEIKNEIAKKNYEDNLKKLYPDAKPTTADIDDAIWQKRKNDRAGASERAKLESITHSGLNKAMAIAVILQIISVPISVAALIFQDQNTYILMTLWMTAYMAQVASVLLIFKNIEEIKHRTVSGNQATAFRYTTIIPGVFLRFIFVFLASKIPITGSIIGTVVGVAIGAGLHYAFLNRYGIYVSSIDTFTNTLIGTMPLYITLIYDKDSLTASIGIIYFAVNIFEYFLGDRFAMLMAYRTNK